ncbi:hypothetical protein ES703_88941 [subsurface metagenome]
MLEYEDWLQDPLREKVKGHYQHRKLKNADERQNSRWWSFHFSTRLKLDAADYFCRQLIGAASMPDNLGLPLLAHRQLKWNLDAFFFELMSAYDILLQELNIVFAYDSELEPSQVKWGKIKDKVPKELVQYMDTEWKKEWFKKIRIYRNMATHHAYVPISSWKGRSGDKPLDYNEYDVSMMPIPYLDSSGQPIVENINHCKTYLKKMAKYIIYIWGKMVQEFQ